MPVDPSPPAGKVAIVAGGARGIGRACALRLADLGARVAVLDVSLAGAATYGEQLRADTVEGEITAGRNGRRAVIGVNETAHVRTLLDVEGIAAKTNAERGTP
jgi:NAD(P)-dependent dehydrogenase (short-subunit alcohol dehydrogenase family)